MPLSRLTASRLLRIERFSNFGEFRPHEVLGIGTSTPLQPDNASLSRAILPLPDGLFVLQRTFARRFEAEIGTPWGIGLSVPFSFHTITNGRELDSSTIGVVRGTAPVESIAHGPNAYMMMRFNSDMRQRGWADYDTGLVFARSPDPVMARMRAAISSMFSLASDIDDPTEFEAIARPIQETLLACLDDTLVAAPMLAARRGSFDTHRKLMAQLDDIVAQAGGRPLYSEDLSRALGVAVRTLQLAARTTHGMSLHQYLRIKRLWSARVQLMTGAAGLSVKAAALDNGFWHFGDFSRSYRITFGETPSETLSRSRR